jgi:ComF family protein
MAVPSLKSGFTVPWTVLAETFFWAGLDLVFPPVCQNCRQTGERLCSHCQSQLEYLTEPVCRRCGYPQSAPMTECDQCRRVPFSGSGLRSLAFHSGPMRHAIHSLKYRHNPPLAQTLAGLMARDWPPSLPTAAMILPVPLAVDRLRERGFNQAELLARHLAAARRQPFSASALRRARTTRSQVGLNAQERRTNVTGAFAAEPAKIGGATVILIDDVCTTGATLSACATALLKGGAKEVWAYTLARAKHDSADSSLTGGQNGSSSHDPWARHEHF